MMNIFSMDSKLYKAGMVLGEMFLLGMLWTIMSLPIVTIGASTTALYYVCTKKAAGSDDYLLRGFLKSFKENFLKATVITVLLMAIGLLIWTNLHILGQLELGALTHVIRFALYFVLVQAAFIMLYVFAILSRFEVGVLGAVKWALFMSYRHFKTTIGNIALIAALVIIALLMPVVLLFSVGIYVYLSSYPLLKIFSSHSAEFEKLQDGLR